jgi:hypothetical protein
MSKTVALETGDALLKPLGFTRQKTAWNRRSGSSVEVIELQVSKAGDTATVSAGVLDTDAHIKLWGSEPPPFVEEPSCTVSARVGELVEGKDVWWELRDSRVGEKISTAIADHVLPFVNRMRSRQEMVEWLTAARVVRKRYPLPIINLAILQHLLGRSSEACALLAEVEKRAIGGWRSRATEVGERLGCVLSSADSKKLSN